MKGRSLILGIVLWVVGGPNTTNVDFLKPFHMAWTRLRVTERNQGQWPFAFGQRRTIALEDNEDAVADRRKK